MTRLLCITPASFLDTVINLTVEHFGYTYEQAVSAWPSMGSPSGNPPATYYWLSAEFTPSGVALADALAKQLPETQVIEYDFATQPEFPYLKRLEMHLIPLP